ncbi:MAG: chromosome segregation protein SMC [Bryobacterales bacterium]
MLRLKKLELVGFKSFCDKEELHFPGSGIASVVGPNGCGKSNISDSISWVLGEQSAKSLRGGRMLDVIFNGSRDRKPAGAAMVTMTLFDPEAQAQNSDAEGQNVLSHAGGKPKRPGEVQVTRKLLRSGDSDYLINGRSVRLRDVHDLFMGTGLGPNHYAIIEQGRIGQVLSSKPLDRRALVEEAAGVTKFKTRKRLAELKLESAKQNLHRVNDILQEVTRQSGSLKRQAARAKKYEEYRQELSEAATSLFASRFRRMDADIQSTEQNRKTAQEQFEQHSKQAEQLETELNTKRDSQHKCEAELQTGREELSKLTVEVERLRSRIAEQARSAEESQRRKSHAEAEIVSITERLAQYEQELTQERNAVEQVDRQAGEVQAKLAQKTQELEARRKHIHERAQEQESSRRKVLALMGEVSGLRNAIAKIEEFLAGNERQVTRARQEEAAAQKELEQIEHAREQLEAKLAEQKQRIEGQSKRAGELDEEIRGQREQAKSRRQAADQLQGDLSRMRARRESLEEILSHHAYTTETVKTMFAAIEKGRVTDFKPIGILADIVEVAPQYERAAEDFLREELEFIVVNSWDEAIRGVGLLKSDLQGHATFLVHPDKPVPSDTPALGPETGVTGRLADHIHLQNGLAESASTLLPKLRGCYLVEEEEAARKLAVRYPDLYFLLPSGVCYRGYTVSGGRKSAAGPLALKRELRELRPKLAELERLFAENRSAAEQADERIGALTVEREQLRSELEELQRAALSLRHENTRLEEQAQRGERRRSVSAQEAERLGKEAERASRDHAERLAAIEQRERDRQSADEALEQLKGALEAAQNEVSGLAEEQTSFRAEAAALDERRRAAKSALARVQSQAEEQKQRRDRIQAQVQNLETERLRLLADNEQLSGAITGRDERQKALQERVQHLAQSLTELREGVQMLEQQMREVRGHVETARQGLSKLEVDLAQRRSDLRHLSETCEAELKQPIEEVAKLAAEDLSAEQLVEAETRYRDVKDRIEKLGPVNVLALEEYEEASRRQEFLETQQADLLNSIRDTQQAIHEIDSASKKQFKEAFDVVNENFKKTFTTLFGGGVGEMRLTDEENVGESGIDIVASPPGRNCRTSRCSPAARSR